MLDWLKARGINSNWDMVFLTFSCQLLYLLRRLEEIRPAESRYWLKEPIDAERLKELGRATRDAGIDFRPSYDGFIAAFSSSRAEKHELLLHLNRLAEDWLDVQQSGFFPKQRPVGTGEIGVSGVVSRRGFVSEGRGKQAPDAGKAGVSSPGDSPGPEGGDPKDIAPLRDRGIVLGIGTGRPRLETEVPLRSLGLLDAFEPERIVTASEVVRAEESHPDRAPLGKPHPFTYVKGYLGLKAPDEACLDADFPLPGAEEVLIVGDSVADLLAARRMGCRFAATLTGLTGEKARPKFEELGADYILEDVTRLPDAIF